MAMLWALLIEFFLTVWSGIHEERQERKRAKRNRKIHRTYWKKGHTVARLADAYGLTHAEVQEILEGGHGPYVPSRKPRPEKGAGAGPHGDLDEAQRGSEPPPQ